MKILQKLQEEHIYLLDSLCKCIYYRASRIYLPFNIFYQTLMPNELRFGIMPLEIKTGRFILIYDTTITKNR